MVHPPPRPADEKPEKNTQKPKAQTRKPQIVSRQVFTDFASI